MSNLRRPAAALLLFVGSSSRVSSFLPAVPRAFQTGGSPSSCSSRAAAHNRAALCATSSQRGVGCFSNVNLVVVPGSSGSSSSNNNNQQLASTSHSRRRKRGRGDAPAVSALGMMVGAGEKEGGVEEMGGIGPPEYEIPTQPGAQLVRLDMAEVPVGVPAAAAAVN